jgi:hypothetical protein
MNRFLVASAGVFVAIGGASETTVAEHICAVMSRKIATEHDKMLDPSWWGECVSMIPGQVHSSVEKYEGRLQSEEEKPTWLANLCVSSNFRQATLATLPTALGGLIATLPPLHSLNCLTIALSSSGALQISLAILATHAAASGSSASGQLTETIVDYANKNLARRIDGLFGGFKPLKNEPYYVCVRPTS